MVMKIENYSGTADTFTFPYNPRVFDATIDGNHEFTNIPFSNKHYLVSGDGVSPKSLILTGHLSGTSKRANYRTLSRHFIETTKLKKLYFESDKFSLGVGRQIKETNTGGRTNFIDYVATFETILGILLGDTQQTYTEGGSHKTNSGNVTTFIEEISGTVTSGSSDITVTDNIGNALKIPSGSLTTGQAVVLTFIKMVDSGSGIYISEYNYCTVAGTRIKTVQTTGGDGIIKLEASRTTADLTITNLDATYTVKFRDGWSA